MNTRSSNIITDVINAYPKIQIKGEFLNENYIKKIPPFTSDIELIAKCSNITKPL